MVMSTLWSRSRVEMRTAWLEVHGTGACSGREYHSVRERRPRENTPPSPTGTHTHARSGQHANIHPCSVCVSISHLFTPTCFPSRCPSPHLMSLGCPPAPSSVTPVFSFPPLVHHLYTLPPPCIVYVRPRPCSVRTVCTVPLIDSINGQKFTIEPQGGGDENGFARGAWDWSMLWKRVPLGAREKKLRKTETEPYRYRKNPRLLTNRGGINTKTNTTKTNRD